LYTPAFYYLFLAECLVPNVGYVQKWAVFQAIPFLVALALLTVHAALFAYKRFLRGQRNWELLLSHVDTLVASFLTLFFFLFLQLFKMQASACFAPRLHIASPVATRFLSRRCSSRFLTAVPSTHPMASCIC
jgi:hypothetical protein